jgi:superfamily II DNA/RNA helicase
MRSVNLRYLRQHPSNGSYPHVSQSSWCPYHRWQPLWSTQLSVAAHRTLSSSTSQSLATSNIASPSIVTDFNTLLTRSSTRSKSDSPTTTIATREGDIAADLVSALKKIGLTKPTIIQEMTIPTIIDGHDCIMAAETGSGKTIAYLLPLLQTLAIRARPITIPPSPAPSPAAAAAPTQKDEKNNNDTPSTTEEVTEVVPSTHAERVAAAIRVGASKTAASTTKKGSHIPFSFKPDDVNELEKQEHEATRHQRWARREAAALRVPVHHYPEAIILAPNRELCSQIVSVFQSLKDAIVSSNPDSEVAKLSCHSVVGSDIFPPRSITANDDWRADILVTTPSCLRLNLSDAIVAHCKTLVFDEADALLNNGAPDRPLGDILSRFRNWRGSTVIEEAKKQQTTPTLISDDTTSSTTNINNDESKQTSSSPPLMRRVRKQFVLAAATVPTRGLRSVQSHFIHLFPRAHVMTSPLLHRHKPSISQTFIHIPSSKPKAVVIAPGDDPTIDASTSTSTEADRKLESRDADDANNDDNGIEIDGSEQYTEWREALRERLADANRRLQPPRRHSRSHGGDANDIDQTEWRDRQLEKQRTMLTQKAEERQKGLMKLDPVMTQRHSTLLKLLKQPHVQGQRTLVFANYVEYAYLVSTHPIMTMMYINCMSITINSIVLQMQRMHS